MESRNTDKILLSNAHTALHDLALFEMQTNNHPFELARSTPLGSHDPRQKESSCCRQEQSVHTQVLLPLAHMSPQIQSEAQTQRKL